MSTYSYPGHTYLVFVDLEDSECSATRPFAPHEPFSPRPCCYGTVLSLGPVFSPLFLLFLLSLPLLIISHLIGGLQREVSQLAATTVTKGLHASGEMCWYL